MNFKKHKKIICSVLFISSLCLSGIFLPSKKAEAVWGVGDLVFDGSNASLNKTRNVTLLKIAGSTAVTAKATSLMVKPTGVTAASTKGVWYKEWILDPLLWATINILLEEIADSTVDWINSGFEGGPGFITNYGDFVTDVGDKALGEYIEGSQLAFLCHPFALDIEAALMFQFGGERRAHCTLTDVFDNVDNAVNELGEDWSWSKWDNLTSQNSGRNNFYGAYAEVYTGAILKMKEAEDREIAKVGWAGGLLNFDKCEMEEELVCDYTILDAGESCKMITKEHCTTHTPGKIIQENLNHTLGLGLDRLTVADEFDEIIGALLSQLVKAVFNSAGGLLDSDPSEDHSFSKVCENECALGETKCESESRIRHCEEVILPDYYDTDSCYKWGISVACPDGQVCLDGVCQTISTTTPPVAP